MTHTFLMEAGRWTLEGSWLERNAIPIPVKGRTLVGWTKDGWFTMVTKLSFPGGERNEITLAYKGRLDSDERRFTFVLQHSELGKIEGEGWIAPESIVQRYWVMDDKQLRNGFQTLYRRDPNHYHLSSAIVAGTYMDSTMEALLTRHPDPHQCSPAEVIERHKGVEPFWGAKPSPPGRSIGTPMLRQEKFADNKTSLRDRDLLVEDIPTDHTPIAKIRY